MPFFNGGSSGSGGSGGLPVLSGSGAPGSSLGSTGQIYIDSTNNVFYGPKTASGWPTGIAFGAGSYSELTGVPTEFTPEDHSHAISEITNLQTELDAKSDSTHGHSISDVTNLQTELDAKATTTALDAAVSDLIDGAPDDLNTLDKLAASIADNAAYATAVNLALAGKSDTTHEHALTDLSNVAGTPTLNQVLAFNGVDWRPTTLTTSGGGSSTLAGLDDVSSITPTTGQFLAYSGSEWFATTFTPDYSTAAGNLVLRPFTAIVEIRGDGTNDAAIQLNCSANSHAVKIQAPPHSASASYTLTLPDDAGSAGQVLKTDGSGGLSWLTVGGGSGSFSFSSVPAADDSTGTVGELALDTLYLYACVATNTWKRIPLQTFSGQTGGGGGGSATGIFITSQPVGGNSQNGAITISISATVPSGSINYQWQKYNTSTTAWDDISGGVYSSLSLTGLTSDDDGNRYRCYLTSTGLSDVISTEAVVNVAESGVTGVTSTAPSLIFDRSASSNYLTSVFKGTGKNWSYPGWTLVKEESEFQYSTDNLYSTAYKTGKTSFPSRSGTWNYYLMMVPPNDDSFTANDYYNNVPFSIQSYAANFIGPDATTIDTLDPPIRDNHYTSWNSTVSTSGRWNRSARMRTRVVLTRYVNGVEEQATTNWSAWSNWRSDPAGNVINENSSTVFTTQPSVSAITITPGDDIDYDLQSSAEIAGSNKRYRWGIRRAGIFDADIRGLLSNDTREFVADGDQFDESLDLEIRRIKFGGVGSHDLACLGAADWNKAALSNIIALTVDSTDKPTTCVMREMGGSWIYSHTVGGWIFRESGKVSNSNTGTLTSFDQLTNDNGGNVVYVSGKVDVYIEQASGYGGGSSTNSWDYNYSHTYDINSDGTYAQSLNNYSNNYNYRATWRFRDMTISVNGTAVSDVTSVWSNWIYS